MSGPHPKAEVWSSGPNIFGSKNIVGVRCVYPEELASFNLVLWFVMWISMQYIHTYPYMYKPGKSRTWKFFIAKPVP